MSNEKPAQGEQSTGQGRKAHRPLRAIGYLLQRTRKALVKWLTDRHMTCDISLDPRVIFSGPKLGLFYLYHKDAQPLHRRTDDEGFVLMPLYGRWHRQPLLTANEARTHFTNHLLNQDEEAGRKAIELVDRLLEVRQTVELGGRQCDLWYYDFELPEHKPHPVPWISGLCQGRLIDVLCRAWQLTDDPKYIDAAMAATGVFYVDVEDGGVRSTDAEGNVYYEEYPFPGKYHHVLNGFVFALMGLYDLWRVTGNEDVRRLYDQGLATLCAEGVLDRYDTGTWTAIDQSPAARKGMRSGFYNYLHARQMLAMYKITGLEIFNQKAKRWGDYSRKFRYRFLAGVANMWFFAKRLPMYFRRVFAGGGSD